MFILKNAFRNLGRNKGRGILLGLIITAVLASATVVMLLKDAAGEWISGYRDSFGVEVGLGTDWEYAQNHYQTIETVREDGTVETTSFFEADKISMEELEKYADSEHVKKSVFAASVRYTSDSLRKIELGDNMIVLDGMSPEELCDVYGVENEKDLLQFMSENEIKEIYSYKKETLGMIYGYSDPAYIREFIDGKKKLKEGRFYENMGEAVVGDEFAERNGLHIGDRIKVSGGKKGDDVVKELTVVGIFTNLYANANQADIWIGFEKNDILVGYDTFKELGFKGVNPFMEEIKYFVDEPASMEIFENEVRTKGFPECYKLQYDITEYESIVNPVEKASSFAEDFGKIVLLAGACILMILTVINVRDRKYEIGVLRAIGMPRWQVALGLISEILIIVSIATLIGYIVGNLLIKPVIRLAIPGNDALVDSAAVSLSGIAPVFAVALGLALISGIISTVFITRYEPMRIFRQAD